MPQMPTINLAQPVATVYVIPEAQGRRESAVAHPPSEVQPSQLEDLRQELGQQKDELDRLLETMNGIAAGLHQLHEQTLASHHAEIAKLAVEIARRILMYKADQGDYDIQAIVAEALQEAPTRQNTVVRLNPEDLSRCQQLQQENPQSPFAELELTADWSIGRGECLVETPKGIVKSFIEEHLERISEALQRVE